MPLMVVKSHASRLDVHFLFTVGEAHGERDAAIAYRQIQVISSVTWTKLLIRNEPQQFD